MKTRQALRALLLPCVLVAGAPGLARAQVPEAEPVSRDAPASQDSPRDDTEVTTEEVRRFLDPTLMVSRLGYSLQTSFLTDGRELFMHRLEPWYAINASSAAWLTLPYAHFTPPGGPSSRGVGDVSLGWGYLVHENVRRRMTAVAAGIDVLLPTGDPARGTGFGRYVLRPRLGAVFNPTDVFPVNFIVRYMHSIDSGDSDGRDRPVRTLQLELRTFHILPKGFFLAFLPTLSLDLHQDFNVLSIGVGGGRALTRRLAVQVGYIEHLAGRETFSRGFVFGLTYLWGENKETRQR